VTAGIVAALSATRYGYYYDELYFIAAGKRLSFSYDQLIPVFVLTRQELGRLARLITDAAKSLILNTIPRS
jgi:hypothetical protein